MNPERRVTDFRNSRLQAHLPGGDEAAGNSRNFINGAAARAALLRLLNALCRRGWEETW